MNLTLAEYKLLADLRNLMSSGVRLTFGHIQGAFGRTATSQATLDSLIQKGLVTWDGVTYAVVPKEDG